MSVTLTGNLTVDVAALRAEDLVAKVPTGAVSALPAASAANSGLVALVTDANGTTVGATVAGGGAHSTVVISNGSAWKIVASLS